jgi:hypothetical protein
MREVLAPVGVDYTAAEYYGPCWCCANPVFLDCFLARRGRACPLTGKDVVGRAKRRSTNGW